jgi:hypothetical protein
VVEEVAPRPREARFASRLSALLSGNGLHPGQQAAILRATADTIAINGAVPTCHIVPFVPGRRPTDEDAHPGLGSSDDTALLVGGNVADNRACLLFELHGLPPGAVGVDATVSLTGPDGTADYGPLPGWDRRALALDLDAPTRHRVELLPERDFADADLGFATRFLQRARVELRVTRDGVPIAGDEAWLDVCDVRNLGLLYDRIVARLVVPDTTQQAAAAHVPDPGVAYHPWFPVLQIGTDKAALYSHALVGDIVGKERHLTDPAWLLRVGVYLELLTCLGIVEAVRDDVGDLLSAEERALFDDDPAYGEVRRRIDPQSWRRVWELRHIAFPRRGTPRTGPVSALNLLHKKRATLAFLHVHHDDLKHAIELAGPNHHNAQETWQRVFRDAERAVLRQTAAAFPELAFLPPQMRELVLWQRRGLAEQQGLFPTACNQYRASMNAVAEWAKQRDLMDHTGPESIPPQVSLLEARLNAPDRIGTLQARDGYSERLDIAEPRAATQPTTAEFQALLAEVPILRMLTPDDVRTLANTARPLLLGPTERFLVQGREGTSLFLVADGTVEVVVRGADGHDEVVDRLGRGAVVGEMALLTGEQRRATVRAVDAAMVYEVGREQYEPLLRAHPEWLDELAAIMEQRLAGEAKRVTGAALRERLRRRFFGG